MGKNYNLISSWKESKLQSTSPQNFSKGKQSHMAHALLIMLHIKQGIVYTSLLFLLGLFGGSDDGWFCNENENHDNLGSYILQVTREVFSKKQHNNNILSALFLHNDSQDSSCQSLLFQSIGLTEMIKNIQTRVKEFNLSQDTKLQCEGLHNCFLKYLLK